MAINVPEFDDAGSLTPEGLEDVVEEPMTAPEEDLHEARLEDLDADELDDALMESEIVKRNLDADTAGFPPRFDADGQIVDDDADVSDGDDGEAHLEPGDIEAGLDDILAGQLVAFARRAYRDDDEAAAAVQPNEFVCRACSLIKSRSQLVDPSGQRCRDCA